MARSTPRRRAERSRPRPWSRRRVRPTADVRHGIAAAPGATLRTASPTAPTAPRAPTSTTAEPARVREAAPRPAEPAASPEPLVQPPPGETAIPSRVRLRVWATAGLLLALAGGAALVAGLLRWGPPLLPEAGAAVVAAAYVWALAARTGGRPVVFGLLALAVAGATVASDQQVLRNGTAAMTCAVTAVLAVVGTVPAVRSRVAVREVVVAVLVAALGGLATAGFRPSVDITRFEYLTLGMALLGALVVVYRLGAGLHGLGRRGLLVVVVGGVLLALTLAYGELLRRYGTPTLVQSAEQWILWVRDRAGASPRPILAVLGVPALMWGVHMRARRRQGWWVCVFGVAATAPVAQALLQPAVPLQERALALAYGVLVGLVLGYLLIRADLALTGGRGTRGRRGRRAEEAAALRPEPPRLDPLL